MKQIFFKTVREDGGSVWAVGKHRHIYEVGKKYKFHPQLPAHVFGLTRYKLDIGNFADEPASYSYGLAPAALRVAFPQQEILHDIVYVNRAEQSGSRVLIGYGEVRLALAPYCSIGGDWDFRHAGTIWQYVCDEFDITGEIKPTHPRKDYGLLDDTFCVTHSFRPKGKRVKL